MLTYLLHVSAIWSLSLVVYLLALRKEAYHGYNRLYLLATLVMGLVLPLLPGPGTPRLYVMAGQGPLLQAVQQPLQPAAAVPSVGRSGQTGLPWLLLLYLTGAASMLALLLRDGLQLLRLYRKGRSSRADGWTIIETGEGHGPFSFRQLLFVSSREAYTDAQWRMILDHERQHARLGHSADLLLIQLLRVVCWFHPLVHAYHRLLLLLHEYEADARVQAPLPAYGRFLVEQSLLQGAPSFAHSFNRSPIKNRIRMLSASNIRHHYARLLLALPLALISVCYFTKDSLAQQASWEGTVLSYRGNKIEMKVLQPQMSTGTIRLNEGSGADKTAKLSKVEPFSITIFADTTPAKLNGRQVYYSAEVDAWPKLQNSKEPVSSYLFRRLKPLLDRLPDGKGWMLDIRDLLIDDQGKVVYFKYRGLFNSYHLGEPEPTAHATPAQVLELKEKVYTILHDELKFAPAVKDGKPAPYLFQDIRPYQFEVGNGKATLKPGC